MSDHDLDRVILACHAARIEFVGRVMRLIAPRSEYTCDDTEILAAIIEVGA